MIKWARTQWDRVLGWAGIAFGAVAILLGWYRVGGESLTAQQLPYVVSGGIGGLFLLGVGAALLLSADLRDEWRRLEAIERNQEELLRQLKPEGGVVVEDMFAAPLLSVDQDATPISSAARKPTKAPARATRAKAPR